MVWIIMGATAIVALIFEVRMWRAVIRLLGRLVRADRTAG
jgi:hypothetical protein